MVHIWKTKKVLWTEIREINKELNGTSKAMANVFCVGNDESDESAKRTWSNYNSDSCTVPALRICPKLHKPLGEGGAPKTRPIVGASTCMAARASEVISDVLDAFVEGTKGIECESTEQMLARMNKAEIIIAKEGVNVIGGSGLPYT